MKCERFVRDHTLTNRTSMSEEYTRWGCVYFKPPEDTPLRFEISRRQLAEKISRGEFANLPVDIGHAKEVAKVGRITDAVQAQTNGSVFVRLAVKPGTLESDFAISAMRSGGIRGLSLSHDPSNDERKLLGVGITPKPGRPNTFLLPEGTEPPPQLPRSQLASFSAFEAVDIYGTLDALPPHNSNTPTSTDKMSNSSSAPASASASATSSAATPAPNTAPSTTTPNAVPASANTKADAKGVMLDGEIVSPEEFKAVVEFARKAKQELEETKRAMAEKESLLKPMLEEQKNKALKLMEGLFNHGVAAVSEAEKKEIEETQQRLLNMVEKDPQLLAKIAKYSSAHEAKTSQPVRERDALGRFVADSLSHHQNQHHPNQSESQLPPRDDRRSSVKRTRAVEELLNDPITPASSLSSSAVENILNKRSLREPASTTQTRQLHPSLREILGAGALEQRQAVAYSNFSADSNAVFEAFERNRVEALKELVKTPLLPTMEFNNIRHYEEYLRNPPMPSDNN